MTLKKLPKGTKLAPRFHTFELNGNYTGWAFVARANPTLEQLEVVVSGGLQGTIEVLTGLVNEWNFVDESGDDLGVSAESMRRLPADLVRQMSDAITEAVFNPPKNS